MPIEDKQRLWKIQFDRRGESLFTGSNLSPTVQVGITSPDNKWKLIKIIFPIKFLDHFFPSCGPNTVEKIFNENESLFKNWVLVKIEECIKSDCLKEKLEISDVQWAERVKGNSISPLSQQESGDVYIYTEIKETKIEGFRKEEVL